MNSGELMSDIDQEGVSQPIEVEIPIQAFLPHYVDLIDSKYDINFLWGGRDSGKSHFIAQKLIYDCLNLPYFRCMLIRKTENSVRSSQYELLKDIIEAWGFEELFEFKLSPLQIICKVNGNKFLGRGCDNPQNIKSTANPSHAWYEEGNQITVDDFITVTTSIRAPGHKTQQWFSFNPECDGDYEDFWLWQMFFKGHGTDFSHKWEFFNPVTEQYEVFTYTSRHSTYHHNPFCTGTRIVFLENLSKTQPYYYAVYTMGLWGRRQNNSPFAFAFDRAKHISNEKISYNPKFETYVSFDFNRSPICAGIYQYYDNTIWGVESIKLATSDIYKLCDYIMAKYPGALFMVTGDATGRASSALVQDGINYYTIIKQKLRLNNGQLRVPNTNPSLKENQVLVNAVLSQINVKLDQDNCKPLIFDLENVRMLPDGSIDKSDRNDPTKQADSLDHFRYLCNTFFRSILKL